MGLVSDVDQRVFLNGIDATTGLALGSPLSSAEVIALLRGDHPGWFTRVLGSLRRVLTRAFAQGPHLGLPDDDDIDPTDPRTVGWAVAVASNAPPEAEAAADRLYEHRLRHTGIPGDRCKRLTYPAGFPLDDWLRTQRAHAADILPTRLPYYVLLVGEPDSVPFEVQSTLGVHYAVGRLAFDEPAAYGRYVEGLLDYETAGGASPRAREVLYWATRNSNDRATDLSARCLAAPLFAGLPATDGQPAVPAIASVRGFRSTGLIGADANRARLLESLHGRGASVRPSIIFIASHGLGWPSPHPDQPARQGGLICQDWPGPGTSPRAGDCVTAADLEEDAHVHGLIAFFFACYGGGTPAFNHFPQGPRLEPKRIATAPFVAALPQRLLGHPGGNALAVVGHVERAWAYSIQPPRVGTSLLPFRNFLSRVMKGEPVGHAIRDFGDRFTSASVRLLEAMGGNLPGPTLDEMDLASAWLERNDARNYIVLGDPVARVRVEAID
jgi:hypothetical protein